MADIGDRVVVAAAKGAPLKRGIVVAKTRSVLTLKWQDGHTSWFTPAPGTVWVERKADAGHFGGGRLRISEDFETLGQADEEPDETEEWEGGKEG